MLPTLYQVEKIGSGFLAVMGRPRAGDWAKDEFAGLATAGITNVVSLLESAEATELGLEAEGQFCAAAGIEFHSFPIPDRGVPSSVQGLSSLSCQIYHQCAAGRNTAIHCRAGIGRSGLAAAAVLLHCGFEVREAFAALTKARGVSVPDTTEQREWLEANAAMVGKCQLHRSGW